MKKFRKRNQGQDILTEEEIELIAQCMAVDGGEGLVPCDEVSSGYTYIGQFLSHELTPITASNRASRQVSGYLDLESIYGYDQSYELEHLNDHHLLFDSKGYFKFGHHAKLDFQRNKDGIAIIPEKRNDDNAIVAQMHMFWQRLHNCLLKNGLARNASEAKKYIVLTFQIMIVEDFLPRIMDDLVYKEIVKNNNDYLEGVDAPWFDLFRFSAFRFGHSMIANYYTLRPESRKAKSHHKLKDLFLGSRKNRRLYDDDYIDWQVFFLEKGEPGFEGVYPLDTRINSIMTGIPGDDGKNISIHIAKRNIHSEMQANLASGIETAMLVQSALPSNIREHFNVIAHDDLKVTTFEWLKIPVHRLTNWLYILAEAELHSKPHKLGFVGSSINIHVILRAIKGAQTSIYESNQYSFTQVTEQLRDWGMVLRDHAKANRSKGCGLVTMASLVQYLNENE